MTPTTHQSNNLTLTPPEGVSEEDCQTIRATTGVCDLPSGEQAAYVACFWKPNAAELELLNQGRSVVVMHWGTRVVPHSVAVSAEEKP